MTLVRATASGAVAVVDRRAWDILEGLGEGRGGVELARRQAETADDMDDASLQIAAIRRVWLGLTAPPTHAPAAFPAANTGTPVLDAVFCPGEQPVRLRVWPQGLARILAAVTAPCRCAIDPSSVATEITVQRVRGRYWLSADGAPCLATREPMLARSEVLRRLVLASHPERRWLAVLHAAGVAGPGGAALLCGSSGAGKSTLTGMLLAHGFPLITDDYAPIEAGTRALWTVRFGLSVKEGSWPLLRPAFPALARAPVIRTPQRRQRYVAPREWAAGPVPVRCLVFPLYGAGEPIALIRLDPGEALALLARSGGWYESSSERLGELTEWLGALPAYALSYGDGEAAVRAVGRLLAVDA